MNDKIKISVIIPVFKVEKYLSECINSVLNQTLKDIEIILVDDESPDNCPKMCDDYAKVDSRVKVIHKNNAGLGLARNSGLEVANGKYVAFLDSDDIIDLDAYEILYNTAEQNDLDMLCFSYNRFADNGFKTTLKYDANLEVLKDKMHIRQSALGIFDHAGLTVRPIGGSSCMALFKRSIIEQHHLRFVSEREYISEDFIFTFMFSINSNKVGLLPNTYYHYRLNWNSLTKVVRLDRMAKAELYANYVSSIILKMGFTQQETRFAIGYYIGIARTAAISVFQSHLSLREKKKWFKEQVNSEFFQDVKKSYPISILPVKQKVCLWAMLHKCFWLTYLIIVIFSKIRKNEYR